MLIVLNNKCNFNKQQFIDYITKLDEEINYENIILCPSATNIGLCDIQNIKIGSQNVSENDNGAYTGEVSAEQLKSFGAKYCIVGHSERRKYQKETNENINKKIIKLLEKDIIPILCIGETLEERNQNLTDKVIKKEITEAMDNIPIDKQKKIIIAYEPIWSIGTGIIPTNEEIDQVLGHIKELIPNVKTLYGGSANEKNINQLNKCKEIDGYLLGGLSLNVNLLKEFIQQL